MRSNAYCGNLMWQSCLTLLALERDSKLPFWVILGGEVIACFATWYAIHSVWGCADMRGSIGVDMRHP